MHAQKECSSWQMPQVPEGAPHSASGAMAHVHAGEGALGCGSAGAERHVIPASQPGVMHAQLNQGCLVQYMQTTGEGQ